MPIYMHLNEHQMEEARKEYYALSKKTTEYSIENIRRMHIFAAALWKNYYVVYASSTGDTIDDEGVYPDDIMLFFVNRKTGEVRIGRPYMAEYYTSEFNDKAMTKLPFEGFKIG